MMWSIKRNAFNSTANLTSNRKSSHADVARRFWTLKEGMSGWLRVWRVMMGMKDRDATNPGKKASDQEEPVWVYTAVGGVRDVSNMTA